MMTPLDHFILSLSRRRVVAKHVNNFCVKTSEVVLKKEDSKDGLPAVPPLPHPRQ